MKKIIVILGVIACLVVLYNKHQAEVKDASETGSVAGIYTGFVYTGQFDTGAILTGDEALEIEPKDPDCGSGIKVNFTFTKEFVDTYKYEDAKNYCFALKIIYSGEDLGYYNTFRNDNGGVSNDRKNGLDGCIPAYKVNQGYSLAFKFGSEVNVANSKGKYGYKKITLPADYEKYSFKFSPTKETNEVMEYETEFVECIY